MLRRGRKKERSCFLKFRSHHVFSQQHLATRGCNVLNKGHMGLKEALPLVARAHPEASTPEVRTPSPQSHRHTGAARALFLLSPTSDTRHRDMAIFMWAYFVTKEDISMKIIKIITSEIIILLYLVHSKRNKYQLNYLGGCSHNAISYEIYNEESETYKN